MKPEETKTTISEKRETPLVNRVIMKRTEYVFPEETKLILAGTNLMRRITSVSKDAIKEFPSNPSLSAIMNLFARNRELVHFSMICLTNGGYASTKVLSRVALENILCMRLFKDKPDLATEWFSSPVKFRENWPPGKIRDELFSRDSSFNKAYRVFYEQLCNYSHPSFRGWSEQILKESILWHPVFSADYASECIGLIFFVIVQSLILFKDSFRKWLPENFIVDINNILPKSLQMVRKHFKY
jgi:hypothetical protein